MELQVSYSSLETFRECPRRFFYEKVFNEKGIRAVGESTEAMNFGSFIHRAFALIGFYGENAHPYLTKLFKELEENPTPADNWTEKYSVVMAKNIVLSYLTECKDIYRDMSAVEVWVESVILDTKDYKIKLVGIIDGIIAQGGIRLVEHKTTTWSPGLFMQQSLYGMQWKLYCHLAEKVIGIVPQGVVYNLVAIDRKKTGYTIEQQMFDRTDITIRTVEDYLKLYIGQLCYCLDAGFWPEGNCFRFNRVCEYRCLCNQSDPLHPFSVDGFTEKEQYHV